MGRRPHQHAHVEAHLRRPTPEFALAACRTSFLPSRAWTADPSVDAELAEAARHVCAGCPEREPCLEWALSQPETSQAGTLGGLSPRERRAMIRQRKRQRALATVPAGGARANAAKQVCDSGHKLSGANLVLVRDPRNGKFYRQCRECRKARKRVSARLRSQRDKREREPASTTAA